MRVIFKIMLTFLLVRKKVVGLENIPASGPYLILINHVSHLDFVIVMAAGPTIRFHFFCSEKWTSARLSDRYLSGWVPFQSPLAAALRRIVQQ